MAKIRNIVACGNTGLKSTLMYLFVADSEKMFDSEIEHRVFVVGSEEMGTEYEEIRQYALKNHELKSFLGCTQIDLLDLRQITIEKTLYQCNPRFFNKEFFSSKEKAQELVSSSNSTMSYEYRKKYLIEQIANGLKNLIDEIVVCKDTDLSEIVVVGNPAGSSDVYAIMKVIGEVICGKCKDILNKDIILDLDEFLSKHMKLGFVAVEDDQGDSLRTPMFLKSLTEANLPCSVNIFCVNQGMPNPPYLRYSTAHLMAAYIISRFYRAKVDLSKYVKIHMPIYSLLSINSQSGNRVVNRKVMGLHKGEWKILDARILMDEVLFFELYPQLGSETERKNDSSLLNSLFIYELYTSQWKVFGHNKPQIQKIKKEFVEPFHKLLDRESIFIKAMTSVEQSTTDKHYEIDINIDSHYLYNSLYLKKMSQRIGEARNYLIDDILKATGSKNETRLTLYMVMKNLKPRNKRFGEILKDIHKICIGD